MRQSGLAVDGDDGDAPPVFVAVVNYRRPLIASRVSRASARKLFFFSARWGGGSERGRGPAGRAVILLLWRKNGILILGCGEGIMWGKR